jgi:hypothetical protein
VGRLLRIAGLMMVGGFAMTLRPALIGLGLMICSDALVVAHVSIPLSRLKVCKT